jgi:hypothetical protein
LCLDLPLDKADLWSRFKRLKGRKEGQRGSEVENKRQKRFRGQKVLAYKANDTLGFRVERTRYPWASEDSDLLLDALHLGFRV